MIEPFRQRIDLIVALIKQNTKFIIAFKYLVFQTFLPQPFAHKESVFSIKLLERCISSFSCANWSWWQEAIS